MKKNLISNKAGVSPVIGVIIMVAITVILAAVVAWFVFGGIGGGSQANGSPNETLKEKNPHIIYADGSGLVTVRGISPEEVNVRIGEIHKEGCFSEVEHAAEYDPIQSNFYATVYISTDSRCTESYKQ